jgi:hypothetical protein
MCAQRTFREIRLLRYMIHDNVIALRDLFATQASQYCIPEFFFFFFVFFCSVDGLFLANYLRHIINHFGDYIRPVIRPNLISILLLNPLTFHLLKLLQ